jgi:hypothetical protein
LALIVGLSVLVVVIYLTWYRSTVGHVDQITSARRELLVVFTNQLPRKDLFAHSLFIIDEENFWTYGYESLFYGWNLPVLLVTPGIVWVFRKRTLVVLIGASVLIYLLISRFPIFAIPYVYFTYFEILFTPARNMTFFIHILTGALLYLLAVGLSRIGKWWLALAGVVVVLVAFAAALQWGSGYYETWRDYASCVSMIPEQDCFLPARSTLYYDVFYLPTLLMFLVAITLSLRSKLDTWDWKWLNPDQPPKRWPLFFALLVIPLAAWTYTPTNSPLKADRQMYQNTPEILIDGLPCSPGYCTPDYALTVWARANLPLDAVVAIDVKNGVMPVHLMPQRVDAWPYYDFAAEFHRNLFPTYAEYYDLAQGKYGEQPFFNGQESLDERLAFAEGLQITHVLVDPDYYKEMRAVLAQWPDEFELVYDDGARWAVYRIAGLDK